MNKVLITGAAGFIGSQLSRRLMDRGLTVKGLDNFNEHLYTPRLKRDRMVHFDLDIWGCDLKDEIKVEALLREFQPDTIVHLAAMAGVRDSLGKEKSYHANNIDATQNLIDTCKKHLPDTRIVYASTSCIYAGAPVPWVEGREHGKQLNAYGYTKWANECQMQSSGLDTVGLRFFTVYGPWGRPDMALFDFTKNILDEQEITVYNYGDMKRDFGGPTLLAEGVVRDTDGNPIERATIDSWHTAPMSCGFWNGTPAQGAKPVVCCHQNHIICCRQC